MTSTEVLRKRFIAGPDHWDRNRRAAKVAPATIATNTGDRIPGIHIQMSGTWLVITEANAVKLANDIVDTIEESRQGNTPKTSTDNTTTEEGK